MLAGCAPAPGNSEVTRRRQQLQSSTTQPWSASLLCGSDAASSYLGCPDGFGTSVTSMAGVHNPLPVMPAEAEEGCHVTIWPLTISPWLNWRRCRCTERGPHGYIESKTMVRRESPAMRHKRSTGEEHGWLDRAPARASTSSADTSAKMWREGSGPRSNACREAKLIRLG